jgi:hypothetical protein
MIVEIRTEIQSGAALRQSTASDTRSWVCTEIQSGAALRLAPHYKVVND